MRGFDTSEKLTPAQVAKLKSLGMEFGVRYVPLSDQSPSVGISAEEMQAFADNNLPLMLVQFSRTSGFSAATGEADGLAAAHYALTLGYPPGACLWQDLYSISDPTIAAAYSNGAYTGAVKGGMYGNALGMYAEPGLNMTSADRYSKLAVSRYWRSGAQVPNVDHRGYQLLQLWKGNIVIAPGIVIDWDVVQMDYLGSLPVASVKAT